MGRSRCAALVLGLLLAPLSSLATVIPIPNGGFEEPAVWDGNTSSLGAPWVATVGPSGSALAENPRGLGVGVVEGEQRVRLRWGGGPLTSISQVLPQTYRSNTAYTFSVVPLEISRQIPLPDFELALAGLAVRRFRGLDVRDSLGTDFGVSGMVLPGSAIVGRPIEVTISVRPNGFVPSYMSFDAATLLALPIPEPGTGGLLAFGMLGLVLRKRP